MHAHSAGPGAGLSPGQRRAAIAAMLMTILLAALDQTIVSVAVPTIARAIGGFEWMAWVVSGYLIASTAVTPLYGKLSDLVGRRRVMLLAIAVFLVASAACALARTMPELVLARVVQGAGGGGLIATAQSVIADVVPLRERGRYQSYVAIVWAVASMLGPLVGGVLTEWLSWPWIFWINLPVGLLALVLVRSALRAVPVLRAQGRLDLVGAGMLLVGLTGALLPITRVGQGSAWTDVPNLACALGSCAVLAGFAWQQRRLEHPIVPMALLRQPTVLAAGALLFLCFFNFVALSVLVPLRLQLVAGFSAADAGLRLIAMTLSIPFAAWLSGRWLSRTGRVLPATRLGVALVPLALVALSFSPPAGAAAVVWLVVVGLGMGLQMPTALIAVQQSVAPEQLGTVTALTAFFRQLGGAVGVAVLSSVVLARLHGRGALGPAMTDPRSLGRLLDAAQAGGPGLDDDAFRFALRAGAWMALAAVWCVVRLPELARHDLVPTGAVAPP